MLLGHLKHRRTLSNKPNRSPGKTRSTSIPHKHKTEHASNRLNDPLNLKTITEASYSIRNASDFNEMRDSILLGEGSIDYLELEKQGESFNKADYQALNSSLRLINPNTIVDNKRVRAQYSRQAVKPLMGVHIDTTTLFKEKFVPINIQPNENDLAERRRTASLGSERRIKNVRQQGRIHFTPVHAYASNQTFSKRHTDNIMDNIDPQLVQLRKTGYSFIEQNRTRLVDTLSKTQGNFLRKDASYDVSRSQRDQSVQVGTAGMSSPNRNSLALDLGTELDLSSERDENIPREGSLIKYLKAKTIRSKSVHNERTAHRRQQVICSLGVQKKSNQLKSIVHHNQKHDSGRVTPRLRDVSACRRERCANSFEIAQNAGVESKLDTSLMLEGYTTPAPKPLPSIQLFVEKAKHYLGNRDNQNTPVELRDNNSPELSLIQGNSTYSPSGSPVNKEWFENSSINHHNLLDSTTIPAGHGSTLILSKIDNSDFLNVDMSPIKLKIPQKRATGQRNKQQTIDKGKMVVTINAQDEIKETDLVDSGTDAMKESQSMENPKKSRKKVVEHVGEGWQMNKRLQEQMDLHNRLRETAKIQREQLKKGRTGQEALEKDDDDLFDKKKTEIYSEESEVCPVSIKGGIEQSILRPVLENSDNIEKDLEEVKEIRTEIQKAERELEAVRTLKNQAYVAHQETLERSKLQSSNRLTGQELDFLREEIDVRRPEIRQVDKIDDILKRLKFFATLTRPVRINFYRCATYLTRTKGDFVFHEGDVGDLMYVILRGSVNVKISKGLKDGTRQFVTIASLYDGTQFGDLAIMGKNPPHKRLNKARMIPYNNSGLRLQKKTSGPNKSGADTEKQEASNSAVQKRAASIECCEDTELLAIDRDQFHEILLSVINSEMDTKIRTLQLVPFYQNENTFSLMPVVNNLKVMKFKLGQKIVQAGDFLMNFYIIGQGRCKVIQEIVDEHVLDSNIHKKKLKPFKFKTFQEGDEPQEEKPAINESEALILDRRRSLPPGNKRAFDYEPYRGMPGDKILADHENRKFIKHVVFKQLFVGDHFGFRPLLRYDEEKKYKQNNDNRARLSVVADSPNVEIYALPRTSLIYIPDRIKTILLEGISKIQDFDEGEIDQEVQKQRAWRDYQVTLVKDMLTKPEHPNLRRAKETYKVI